MQIKIEIMHVKHHRSDKTIPIGKYFIKLQNTYIVNSLKQIK